MISGWVVGKTATAVNLSLRRAATAASSSFSSRAACRHFCGSAWTKVLSPATAAARARPGDAKIVHQPQALSRVDPGGRVREQSPDACGFGPPAASRKSMIRMVENGSKIDYLRGAAGLQVLQPRARHRRRARRPRPTLPSRSPCDSWHTLRTKLKDEGIPGELRPGNSHIITGLARDDRNCASDALRTASAHRPECRLPPNPSPWVRCDHARTKGYMRPRAAEPPIVFIIPSLKRNSGKHRKGRNQQGRHVDRAPDRDQQMGPQKVKIPKPAEDRVQGKPGCQVEHHTQDGSR